jgi:hypothetical protein
MTDPKNEPSSGSPSADRKPPAVPLQQPTQTSRITSLRVQIWALLTGFNRGVLAVGAFAAAILAIGGVVLALEQILHSDSSSTRPSTHASSSHIAPKKSGTSATKKSLKEPTPSPQGEAPPSPRPESPAADVALSLRASTEAYVCLIGDNGRKLIPGEILQPNSTTQVYHAKHFAITLGNSSVTMIVNGVPLSVPASSQAIGYSATNNTLARVAGYSRSERSARAATARGRAVAIS